MDTNETAGTLVVNPADAAKAATLSKNIVMAVIDEAVTQAFNDPGTQMGVIMMAQVLAFRRLLAHHRIRNRGGRMKLIRLATEEFNQRLREFASPNNDAKNSADPQAVATDGDDHDGGISHPGS